MTGSSHSGGTKESFSKRASTIMDIIELMEESSKSKEWLLQQMKQKGERIPFRASLKTIGILKACSPSFLARIHDILKKGEFSHLIGPPPLTRTYHWFFTDIVDSSVPSVTTNEQAYKIIALNALIEATETFRNRNPGNTMILPTGDGMAIGFTDSSEKPLNLAIQLHKEIQRYNKQMKKDSDMLQVRIGLDTGPVYLIKDLNGNDNVWGPGIIMARRVMDMARGMNILASQRFANDIRTLRPEYKKILHEAGNYPIKHGEKLLIFNVYDEEIGNKRAPPLGSQKSKAEHEMQIMARRFVFLETRLELEVIDPRPDLMLTRHTLEWHLMNIQDEPVDRVFFTLEGDKPRAFPDLNLTITDEENKELEIVSLDVNRPNKKELSAKLRKPLKPRERGRKVKFQWIWEETDRKHSYLFVADCKKFFFKLTVPRAIEINQKVVQMDLTSGAKTYASNPPTVSYVGEKTVVTWKASDLKIFDVYRFDW